jgi:anti-anti-sigma regulatory factor
MTVTSSTHTGPGSVVLRLTGVLNARTYQQVRDVVIKAVVNTDTAVIVDIDHLDVHGESAWTVFTNARWLVQQWPEVPIALVCPNSAVRQRLADLSVARYVPVYPDVAAAAAAIRDGTYRYLHRARERFEPRPSSVSSALLFVHEHLVAWSMDDKIPVASTVVNVFAENALSHTTDGFDVRLEGTDDEVLIAVSDCSRAPAARRERPRGSSLAGLDIVSGLCRRWGNTPTPTGKTVWARIGSADTFAGINRPASGGVVKDQAERIPLAGSHDRNAMAHRRGRPAAD